VGLPQAAEKWRLSMEEAMRTALLTAGLLLLAAPAFAADPVEGEWLTPDGGSKVRIAACPDTPGRMCGMVSWLPAAKAKDLDTRNPNAALRKRPILGVSTISGFKQAAPGKWTGGKLYDPASGKTYDGKITANANGTLKVEGCVMMVCQAQTWKRA
jgi:uncharacterized protein (DUF2147 family)